MGKKYEPICARQETIIFICLEKQNAKFKHNKFLFCRLRILTTTLRMLNGNNFRSGI
jgi:hypothetical protein